MHLRLHALWTAAAVFVILFTLSGPLAADDRDLLRARGVPPNVLLIVDSSGSMSRDVASDSISFIGSGDDPHSKLVEMKYALDRFFNAYPDFNMGFTFYERDDVKINPQVFLYRLDPSSVDLSWDWQIKIVDDGSMQGYDWRQSDRMNSGELVRLGFDEPLAGSMDYTWDPLFGPLGKTVYADWSRRNKVKIGDTQVPSNGSTVRYQGANYTGAYRVEAYLNEPRAGTGFYFPAFDWNAKVELAVKSFQDLHDVYAPPVFDPDTTPEDRLAAFELLQTGRAKVQEVLDDNQIGSKVLTVTHRLLRCTGTLDETTGKCLRGSWETVKSTTGTLISAGGMAPWQLNPADDTPWTYPESLLPLDLQGDKNAQSMDYVNQCNGWQGVFRSATKIPLIPIPNDDDPDMLPYMRSYLRPQPQMQFFFPTRTGGLNYWPYFWDDQNASVPGMDGKGVWVTDRVLFGFGATPIKNSLNDAEDYFKQDVQVRDDEFKSCRKNFVILITDGLETCGGDPCGAAADLGKKKIPVFVIGYGLGTAGNALNCIGKDSGGATYLPNDVEGLVEALRNIGQSIEERTRGFAAPMVPSVEVTSGQKAFLATFLPLNGRAIWQGHLRAYAVSPVTGTIPLTEDGEPIIAEAKWDAGNRLELMPHASRNIYYGVDKAVAVPGTRKDFRFPASSSTERDLLRSLMDDATLTDGELATTIGFIRGDRDPAKYGTEKLGDIFHGVPALSGPPACYTCWFTNRHRYRDNPATEEDGDGFRGTHRYRRQVLYVAANDGLLHAFDAGIWDPKKKIYDDGKGDELFAWAPREVMPTYPDLAGSDDLHRYTVDGSPTVADVFIDHSYSGDPEVVDREWRTVLLVGQRRGGSSYLCLDVTQPDVYDSTGLPMPDAAVSDRRASCRDGGTSCPGEWPAYRWEFTDASDENLDGSPDLGQTWSRPLVGFVKVEVSDGSDTFVEERSVAIFGGGFDPRGKSGRHLYILDIERGAILFKAPAWGMVTGNVAAMDNNLDGFLEEIYWADTQGYVYRMDLSPLGTVDSATERVTSWSVEEFFWSGTSAPVAQPFYLTPTLAPAGPSANDKPYIALAVGAGNRDDIFEPNDVPHEFYVVVDRRDYGKVGTLTPADLQPIALGDEAVTDNYLDSPDVRGWYLILGANEKVNTSSLILNGKLIFSTFKPGEDIVEVDDPDNPGEKLCRRSGDAKTYILNFFNGNPVDGETRFMEHDPITAMAGETGVYLGADGKLHAHTGTDDARLVSPLDPILPTLRSMMWRED